MLSSNVIDMPPFHVMEIMEKAQELERAGHHIIHLEIGEPDYPTASHICEAASKAMCAGETRYTHSQGIPELRKAIADNYNRKFELDIDPNQIIVTSGTSPALLLLFIALLEQGDEVIMSNPHYACYPNFVRALKGKPHFIYTKEEEGFVLDPSQVNYSISARTKAILINSPCNPTGYVMNSRQLAQLAECAGDVPIISDEIYQGLVYEGEDHSILEYTENAFVLNGFSKLYAMTGWRLGYLIAPSQYVRTLQKIQQNFFISTNSFVQHAGVAALTGPQDKIHEMVKAYNKRRLYMLERLKKMGLHVRSLPQGAYYILADAREYGASSLELSWNILKQTGVAVTPGIDFGDGAEGYLRFSYANSIENIKEGMDRLEKYLKSLRGI
ncbi:MAG: pyridoxal phosphate-dependent aminotransferase [Methanomethylovorans sp.]|jgi:aspartate/methionine/tyrosine aminotransferase|nr:pyridoxal phosphate-dependent aminotransferase [Methanomethylovorans sp.]